MKNYSLSKANLNKLLRRVKEFSTAELMDDKEFVYYHKNRNYFNNKYGGKSGVISTLTQVAEFKYKDNFGKTWDEEIRGTQYHNNKTTYSHAAQQALVKEQYSDIRKFLRKDEETDSCQFELILRRVFLNSCTEYYNRVTQGNGLETYNFGAEFLVHKKFDMNTHNILGDAHYVTTHYGPNEVKIIDEPFDGKASAPLSMMRRLVRNSFR